MSIKVMSLVWESFPRGGSEKLVMLAMADFANDQGGSVHPSISLIGRKCSLSRSQARRIVHALIKEGYLCVIGNQNGGAPSSTRRYQINLSMLTRKEPITTSAGATPRTDATPSTDARQPLAPVRETPSAHASRSIIEPNTEPSGKVLHRPSRQVRRKKCARNTLPSDWKPSASTVEKISSKYRFGVDDIERYLDVFRDSCAAKGYTYEDFDAAFRNCVRDDWGQLLKRGIVRPRNGSEKQVAI
jgi:hypothetical protein